MMKPPNDPNPIPGPSSKHYLLNTKQQQKLLNSCLMKPSLSLTSLQPQSPQSETGEMAQAKMRSERPYNSLKKKRDTEKELWRRSWESQASLQSNNTTNTSGTGNGNNEFWAAYNFIMDTNLIDSCQDAKDESGLVAVHQHNDREKFQIQRKNENSLENGNFKFQVSRSQGSSGGDLRRLRRWLREMDNRISKMPSLTEAMKLKSADLQKCLSEHSDLYREIVSHDRAVAACIRSLDKENFEEQQKLQDCGDYDSLDTTTSSGKLSTTGSRRGENVLKALERRYHLLYLRAIEVQCMFEGLLERRNSPQISTEKFTPVIDTSDEEPVAKVARFSETDFERNDGFGDDAKGYDDWLMQRENEIIITGFDADSEGSDTENCVQPNELDNSVNIDCVDCPKAGTSKSTQQFQVTKVPDIEITPPNQQLKNKLETKTMDIVESFPETDRNGNINESLVESEKFDSPNINSNTVLKRPRNKDLTKFNRSNRKSKNCATFYYKHVDTDSEQNNLNADVANEENFVSSEATSEEETWDYTNANATEVTENDLNGNTILEEQEPEPKSLTVKRLNFDEEMEKEDVTVEQEVEQRVPDMQVDVRESTVQCASVIHSTQMITKETLQLVQDAETLVRKKATNIVNYNNFMEMLTKQNSNKVLKAYFDKNGKDKAKYSRVTEWLKHQPLTDTSQLIPPLSLPTTDCEASGEYSESDSAAHETDTSEGITDSVATCLQGSLQTGTSTEGLGSSVDPLTPSKECDYVTPIQTPKVVMRGSNRRSERPWSVSCLSQLTGTTKQNLTLSDAKLDQQVNTGFSNFSISESALDRACKHSSESNNDTTGNNTNTQSTIKSYDSKNSLKRRRLKTKKRSTSSVNRKSESGSDACGFESSFPRPMLRSLSAKPDSYTFQTELVEDLTEAISMIKLPSELTAVTDNVPSEKPESDEEQKIMRPAFKIGSITNVYATQNNLGSLAALSNYNRDVTEGKLENDFNETGTENMSSFSEQAEQAWDNYQEKYNSEAYSEDKDIDGARRLLEFGDDYRQFLDSQSDCCSSLSAANIDSSMSPPRFRKTILGQLQTKSFSSTADSSLEAMRLRRNLELPETERKRKNTLEERRKSLNSDKVSMNARNSPEKLVRRKQSESDNSSTRRRSVHGGVRVKSSYDLSSSSSSSGELSDVEYDIKNKMVLDAKNNLEKTEALRLGRKLLRPEDYDEIVETCRKNIECLEAVLRGPVSKIDIKQVHDLIASWENLLKWSDNAAVARRLQEEMTILKLALQNFGLQFHGFDSEESIRDAIEDLKKDRSELQKYRSNMLKLNSSVHTWLNRQDMQMQKLLQQESSSETDGKKDSTAQSDLQYFIDDELHKKLKEEVVDMYAAWDEADLRIKNRLENLTTSLSAWMQFENGISEYQEILGKDRGALCALRGALETGQSSEDIVDNVQQVAKLLNEKLENQIQKTICNSENITNLHLDPTALQFMGAKRGASNGSLSDSGISDTGGFSESGLSERERRLAALRRLAKQIEIALSPSGDAIKSVTQRLGAAESNLKTLQDSFQELMQMILGKQNSEANASNGGAPQNINVQISNFTIKGKSKRSPQSKRKSKRKSSNSQVLRTASSSCLTKPPVGARANVASDPEPDDPKDDSETLHDDEGEGHGKRWLWRVARMAVPIQLTIVTLLCAACLLEPSCCDALNNFSMSLTPHLKYVKGPPPI